MKCALISKTMPLRIRSQVLNLQVSADSSNPVSYKLVSTPQCHTEAQNIFKAAVCYDHAYTHPFVYGTILNTRSKL